MLVRARQPPVGYFSACSSCNFCTVYPKVRLILKTGSSQKLCSVGNKICITWPSNLNKVGMRYQTSHHQVSAFCKISHWFTQTNSFLFYKLATVTIQMVDSLMHVLFSTVHSDRSISHHAREVLSIGSSFW